MELKDVTIGVLGGGISGEREVSLVSSRAAYEALLRCGMKAVWLDIVTGKKDVIAGQLKAANVGFAFIALHGDFGEDGEIQKILEDLDMPYSGSDPQASYRAMDKIVTKEIFIEKSIATAAYRVCTDVREDPSWDLPVVVKPFFSGSSLGVSVVGNKKNLPAAIEEALKYKGHKALIEDYIDGRELTVGILQEQALEVVEIVPRKGFYDFANKYGDNVTDFLAPAPLDQDTRDKIRSLGLAAHNALGCRHFSRVDIRLNSKGIPYVLEVNTIPGLTSHSLLPLSAKCCGINFDDLIMKMALSSWKAGKHSKYGKENKDQATVG